MKEGINMERRHEILMKLYWKLWISPDFAEDFQADLFIIYQLMEEGRHYSISDEALEACFQYLQYWEKNF